MQKRDCLFAPIAADKVLGHPAGGRPGLEKGVGHGQVTHRSGLQLSQRFARPLRLTLKDAHGVAAGQQVSGLRVIERDVGRVKAGVVTLPAKLGGIGDDGQSADAQQIELGQSQRLNILMIETG